MPMVFGKATMFKCNVKGAAQETPVFFTIILSQPWP